MRLLALTVFLCTTPALAATSGTLLLKSVVSGIHSLTVNAEAQATNLPLDTSQNSTKVAMVQMKSNSTTGYKINISSANQGKLVHQSISSSSMPYTLTYDEQATNLVTGTTLNYTPTNATRNAQVKISYTGVPHANLNEGNYTDVVTFTISSI